MYEEGTEPRRLTLVVPVYNAPDLARALVARIPELDAAARGSGFELVETILVDDGSDVRLDAAVPGDGKRLVVLRIEPNRGKGAAVRRGAVDFLQKSAPDMNARLIDAVAKAVARSLEGFADLREDPFEARRKLASLTERERTIVEKIAAGALNRQIAAQLGISVRTAETHRAAAMKKLSVKNASELISLLRLAMPSA